MQSFVLAQTLLKFHYSFVQLPTYQTAAGHVKHNNVSILQLLKPVHWCVIKLLIQIIGLIHKRL